MAQQCSHSFHPAGSPKYETRWRRCCEGADRFRARSHVEGWMFGSMNKFSLGQRRFRKQNDASRHGSTMKATATFPEPIKTKAYRNHYNSYRHSVTFDQGCTRCGMGHTMVNGQNILCPMLTLLKSFNVAAPQKVVAPCQISKGAQ